MILKFNSIILSKINAQDYNNYSFMSCKCCHCLQLLHISMGWRELETVFQCHCRHTHDVRGWKSAMEGLVELCPLHQQCESNPAGV